MSEAQTWLYVDSAGQQVGPIPANDLQAYVTAGHITAETQVWTDGLEDWLTADKIEGLVFAQAPVAAPQAHSPQINLGSAPSGAMATATPSQALTPQAGGDYPIPFINKINFGLYITCILAGVGLVILGMVLLGASAPSAEEVINNPNAADKAGSPVLPLVVFAVGGIAMITAAILYLTSLYRAWAVLKPGGGSISPGAAIGMMFIPIFGPIWHIIVLCKLPGEWNRIVPQYTNTAAAPRLSLGMAMCNIFLPVLGQILWMSETAKGVNFMASARLMPDSSQQPSSGGGIVLR